MDIKLVLTQFYLRIGLAHTLTVIIESSTKTLASIDWIHFEPVFLGYG